MMLIKEVCSKSGRDGRTFHADMLEPNINYLQNPCRWQKLLFACLQVFEGTQNQSQI